MDKDAMNYDSHAKRSDNSCLYEPEIGKYYEGGIVFYIDKASRRCLIVSPVDQFSVPWSLGVDSIGATGTAVFTGQQNTEIMLAHDTAAGTAAKVCASYIVNGFDDWYLPSRDELIALTSVYFWGGHEPPGPLWSSSETGGYFAYQVSSGNATNDGKVISYPTRPIRTASY
ncbi:MAG: hypothetical protein ACJ77K_07590 [Bacteroidia bacterium]